MPKNEIPANEYPDTKPTEEGYLYLCWGVNGEVAFADYRAWISLDWVLNEGEVVNYFIEQGRKPVE